MEQRPLGLAVEVHRAAHQPDRGLGAGQDGHAQPGSGHRNQDGRRAVLVHDVERRSARRITDVLVAEGHEQGQLGEVVPLDAGFVFTEQLEVADGEMLDESQRDAVQIPSHELGRHDAELGFPLLQGLAHAGPRRPFTHDDA